MASPENRSRALLLLTVPAVFAISALTDVRVLGLLCAVAPLVFWRMALRVGRQVLRRVVPVVVTLAAASWGWLLLTQGQRPALTPFIALVLRTVTIAFVVFSVLQRADLLRAVAPWPTVSRLLVITLAQIHALRLIATESLQGLRSRMPRRPGALDIIRNAGGITTVLFTLATRNARDISDAMRSRGF